MLTLSYNSFKQFIRRALIIGSSITLIGHSTLHASANNTTHTVNEEQPTSKSTLQVTLSNTSTRILCPSDRMLSYTPGDFPAEFDSLTKIGSTLYFKGEEKNDYIPLLPQSNNIVIQGIIAENETARIASPSEVSYAQKNELNQFDGRELVDPAKGKKWPYRIHGHLMMKFPNGNIYTGSGVMVGPHHVLTAAHNLFDRNSGWAQEVLFAPGRHEDKYPYGDCRGCALLVPEKWSDKSPQNKEWEGYDFGMVILNTNIGKVTGWSGILCLPDELLAEKNVTVTGYPGDKGIGNYYSTQMWEMSKAIKTVTKEQLFYKIRTYEGQSGSAIWREEWPSYEGPYTVGIHTYGEKTEGEGNRGTRITANKFNLILEWLKAYQLPNVVSILPIPQQSSLPSLELSFSPELL